MHLHILGICGTFMGGVARLARAAGHRVSGCDANVYPPMSEQLAAAGVQMLEGYGADQLALRPDLFVVGNVVSRGNPLMEAILDAGAAFTSGPQWVGEHLLRGRPVLAVAGTHGKTTTAAMLAWILECAGRAPGFLIGGVPIDFTVSARPPGPAGGSAGGSAGGRAAWAGTTGALAPTDPAPFVIEADEYDTAFFDKRSKFVHYFPRIAVLNNLEFDHADIFADLAAIETQFHHLVRGVAARGRLVVNADSAALARVLARGAWTPVEPFAGGLDGDDAGPGALGRSATARGTGTGTGPTPPGWWADTVEEATGHAFEVRRGAQRHGRLVLPQAGAHNRANALAALAAASCAGVPTAVSIDALARFGGVKRRLEVCGRAGGVTVYDDFAHHPTAIATTLEGLRRRVGAARILAVLEPRSNTMKLGPMKDRLAPALAAADLVFGFGAAAGRTALGWDLATALAPLGERARAFAQLDALVEAVVQAAGPGDHVLVMSNGGFGGVHGRLLARLGQAAGTSP